MAGINNEIAVRCERRDSQVRFAHSEVDRLGSDEHAGLAMRSESLQCIQENVAGQHVKLIHATSPHSRPSSGSAHLLRRDPGPDWSRDPLPLGLEQHS